MTCLILLGVPPVISTRPPDPSPPTLPPTIMNDTITIGTDICLLEHQFVTIECMTLSGTQPIAFTWTSASTGNRVISTGMRLTVRDPDTYTCNATNAFGSANASSKVARKKNTRINCNELFYPADIKDILHFKYVSSMYIQIVAFCDYSFFHVNCASVQCPTTIACSYFSSWLILLVAFNSF